MWAATAFHPDGYFTAVIRPPTPHAKSGRVNINAAQASPAARYCEERSRTAMTAAAPATAYAGIANATHFWPSRRIPSPGTSVMSQVVSVNPGPVSQQGRNNHGCNGYAQQSESLARAPQYRRADRDHDKQHHREHQREQGRA